jgi:hypothetical protein
MAAGDSITLVRFNNLRNRVATILGTGSGNSGYGQTLPSGIGATLTGTQVVNASHHGRGAAGFPATTGGLLEGVERIKRHQTNTGVTVTLPEPGGPTLGTTATTILDSLYTTLESEMSTLETDPNRFRLSTDPAQSVNTLRTTQTIPANWNTSRVHTFTFDFSNAEQARRWFNLGNQIILSWEVNYSSGGTVDGTKNGRWKNLIDRRVPGGLTSVVFGYTSTTSNTGTPATTIGWYDLTPGAAATQIFTRADSGTYSGNDITINVSKLASNSAITFQAFFNDDGVFGNTPPGDEQITVTFNSYINTLVATGNHVSTVFIPAITTAVV